MQNFQKKISRPSPNSKKNSYNSNNYTKNAGQNSPKKITKKPIPKTQENTRTAQKSANTNFAEPPLGEFGAVQFLTIDEQNDGQRLDNFLLGKLKGVPKSHLYKLIRDGQIRLNKKRIKPMERLSVGDVVRVAPIRQASRENPIVSDELQAGLLARVVFENDGLIVLDKPSGMAVHGGSGESFGVIETIRMASGKPYLELIHRIDKETSGLLMIAKKRTVLKDLQERLRQKTIQKTYLCLVKGHIDKDNFTINKPLLKYLLPNGERRVKIAPQGTQGAKDSVTLVRVLDRFMLNNQAVSLVECQPKTGRTHQIRVHLASLGHPLLGDEKYHLDDKSGVRRLCLHAWRLVMDDYPEFVAKLPDDIGQWLPNGLGEL